MPAHLRSHLGIPIAASYCCRAAINMPCQQAVGNASVSRVNCSIYVLRDSSSPWDAEEGAGALGHLRSHCAIAIAASGGVRAAVLLLRLACSWALPPAISSFS